MSSTIAETSHAKTLGQLNQEHFDSVASTAYSIPWIRELHEQITQFLRDNVEWIGIPRSSFNSSEEGARMLDYACGNGVASRALAPFVSVLRGVDISSGMVEQYNAVARKQTLSESQMHAVQGDLLAETESAALNDPDLFGFDVIVMCAALHHVADPPKMIQKLAERLRPNGSLVIIEGVLPSESGCREAPEEVLKKHGVLRQGFRKQEMLDMFAGAGLVDHGYLLPTKRCFMPEELGGEQQLFYARAKKAPGDDV